MESLKNTVIKHCISRAVCPGSLTHRTVFAVSTIDVAVVAVQLPMNYSGMLTEAPPETQMFDQG